MRKKKESIRNKTPEIIFRYSWIYDEHWKEAIKKFKIKLPKYPSEKSVNNYIRKVNPLWKKQEKRILAELSKVTGLEWKQDKIDCYIVGQALPFSDPLTMPIYPENYSWFVDTLTHELIHRLYSPDENLKRAEKSWSYVWKKYKKETFNTRMHIPLHAHHCHIYLKFFGKKRLERNIRMMRHYPEYKRAWEIVEKEGYKNIIEEFRKRME